MPEDASQAIDRMLALTQRLPEDDDELRAEWIKFLIIAICSHLERGICDRILNFVNAVDQDRLARYIKEQIKNFRNPNPDRIVLLLRSFDPGWADRLKVFWGGQIKDSIHSLVNVRHKAAHGASVSTSERDVRQYAEDAKRLLEFLATLVR